MKKAKTLTFKLERMIAVPPTVAFDAWLNPKIPGTPWQENDELIFNPKVDGFFYWLIRGNAHYGRFIKIKRPSQIQHTWMSRSTLGEESTVTLTFKKKGKETLMTLVHSGLPDAKIAKGHNRGWNYFLDGLTKHLNSKAASRK